MGCTSSVVTPGEEAQAKEANKLADVSKDKKHTTNRQHHNGSVSSAKSHNTSVHLKNQNVDKNGNKIISHAQTPVPKSVAFDVTFDGFTGDGLPSLKKRPPKLQALEPLSVPKLTTEQLQEKQRLADEKREKLKERRLNRSQKASRRRRELLEAREYELKQLTEQEKCEIDSMKQAELNREQRLIELRGKQRLRDERAKSARERVKRMQNPEDDIDVEKDEEFNATSDDSWLDIPDKTNNIDVEEEYAYKKRVGQVKTTVSASTVDSYDAAFMRNNTQEGKNLQTVHKLQNNINIMSDDFFDSQP